MGKHTKEDDYLTNAGFQNDLFPMSQGEETPEPRPEPIEEAREASIEGFLRRHSRAWWMMMGLVAAGLLLAGILFALYYTAGSAQALTSETDTAETALNKVAASAGKSVVTVSCGGASGSGFAVTTDGMIVTAAGLIENGGTIEVKTGRKKKYTAAPVWSDADSGLAVIKIKAQNLTPALLDDDNHLYNGEKLMIMGRSTGTFTAQKTKVLDTDANVLSDDGEHFAVRDLIRLSSTAGSGTAGQPLCDSEGEITGVIVKTETEDTYAMPAYYLAAVVDQLITTGRFSAHTVGIIADSAAQFALRTGRRADFDNGVCVREVAPGSSAEAAGLKPGDVITSIDGESVNSPREVAAAIARKNPGSRIMMTVFRTGEKAAAGGTRVWVTVSETV